MAIQRPTAKTVTQSNETAKAKFIGKQPIQRPQAQTVSQPSQAAKQSFTAKHQAKTGGDSPSPAPGYSKPQMQRPSQAQPKPAQPSRGRGFER